MNLLKLIKDFVTYDADRAFYAKVFPDSVSLMDLVRIRKMHKDDLPDVLKIEAKNYQYPWKKAIFKDCFIATSYSNWVCEDETETIIGYAVLSVGAGEAHIINISIAPEVQGQGIGYKMMTHLIEIARKKAETLFLEVRPSNQGAIHLYNKLGFNEVGLRKGYYPAENGQREDAVILALELVRLF